MKDRQHNKPKEKGQNDKQCSIKLKIYTEHSRMTTIQVMIEIQI